MNALQTDKGVFESFATLRLAYLKAYDGNPPIFGYFNPEPWDKTTLHISELGKCARQQMMRLSGVKPKPETEKARANKELMFWQGNMIHALTVGAMDWAGILVDSEKPLEGLPEGWSGHYDAVYKDREYGRLMVWDGKTVRPNAFNYAHEWPKMEETWQIRGYLRFLPDVTAGIVEHIDRGGSNTPQTSLITRDDEQVNGRMLTLDTYLDSIEVLPGMIPPEWKLTYRKVANEPIWRASAIYRQPSWQCEWCDYMYGTKHKRTKQWTIPSSSPCKPNLTKTQVAKVKNGKLTMIDDTSEALVALWLNNKTLEFTRTEDIE
jgi:hypothetical protein